MKSCALILIKPDGVCKQLTGSIIRSFDQTGLEMIALRVVHVERSLAESHYGHLREQFFFDQIVDYLSGKIHGQNKVVAMIYQGEEAIKKCRKVVGATNPEEADALSIRGTYGRITTQGLFENVVHVSSEDKEAEREIKLWFSPEDISEKIYQTKELEDKKRGWI